MVKLTTSSPLSRRIVLAFLEFLESVEIDPEADVEGLEVARDCLEDVFKLYSFEVNDPPPSGLLVNFFKSLDDQKQGVVHVDGVQAAVAPDSCANGSTSNDPRMDQHDASTCPVENSGTSAEHLDTVPVVSRDELFDHFLDCLRETGYIKSAAHGEDHEHLVNAKHAFDDALKGMENSDRQTTNINGLSETFKSLGNRAMQSKLYLKAIELYTFAIALCKNNAVYYCNRAAAYTQINKFAEAIFDSYASITIDPNYVKAYSRLGLAFYAQGNYRDAIDLGFKKALQLDPTNDTVRENIKMAERKLNEESSRHQQKQTAGPSTNEEPNNQSTSSSHQGEPFSAFSFPNNLGNLFMNVTTHARQQAEQAEATFANAVPPEIRIDGISPPEIRINGISPPEIRFDSNINLNSGGPGQVHDAMRSFMDVFSGSNQPQQHGTRNSSTTNSNTGSEQVNNPMRIFREMFSSSTQSREDNGRNGTTPN